MRFVALAAVMAVFVAAPACAERREFCSSRPGLNTPPCIVERGHPILEYSFVDWTLDRQPRTREDTVTVGQTTARIALGDSTEVQVGWTPYGSVRNADRVARSVSRVDGIGDVTIALRRSLGKANGPVAIQPYVTIPTGGSAIGAGDWGAGVFLPVALPLGGDVDLALTPQVAAAVNESGRGRHLAYGSAIGLSAELLPNVTGAIEAQIVRDRDPSGSTTQSVASTSLAWLVGADTQLDVGTVIGLNDDSPDFQLYFGLSHRF